VPIARASSHAPMTSALSGVSGQGQIPAVGARPSCTVSPAAKSRVPSPPSTSPWPTSVAASQRGGGVQRARLARPSPAWSLSTRTLITGTTR
jgi:hypothetical protein